MRNPAALAIGFGSGVGVIGLAAAAVGFGYDVQPETLERLKEEAWTIAMSLFGAGGAGGMLVAWLLRNLKGVLERTGFRGEIEEPKPLPSIKMEPNRDADAPELQACRMAYRELRNVASRNLTTLKSIISKNKSLDSRVQKYLIQRSILWSILWTAAIYGVGSMLESVLIVLRLGHASEPGSALPTFINFFAAIFTSVVLVVISFVHARKLRRRLRRDLYVAEALLIGCVGCFISGTISCLMTSPGTWSLVLNAKDSVLSVPALGSMPLVVFIVIQRIIIFPICSMVGGLLGARAWAGVASAAAATTQVA